MNTSGDTLGLLFIGGVLFVVLHVVLGWVVRCKLTDDAVIVSILNFVPIFRVSLRSVVAARRVPIRSLLLMWIPRYLWAVWMVSRFSAVVELRRRSHFFSIILISPDDPDAFLKEISGRLSEQNRW